MKYCLSIDSGGTKTAAVLYREDMSREAVTVCGSLRSNTTSAGLIAAHTAKLADDLGLRGKRIAAIGGTFEPSLIDSLKKICETDGYTVDGELDLGLSAAGIFGDGLLALSGTGATVFARIGGSKEAAGGYGAAVSDEGSGYWIGREAFIAAIRDSEGRGERTTLTDAIPEKLGFGGRDGLREAIFSIYRDGIRSPTATVAHFTPTVVKEAARGDAVSIGILKKAAGLLYGQFSYLCKKHGAGPDVPVTVSGSVWRGNPVFTGEFIRLLRESGDSRPFIAPVLEPVLGVLAKRIYMTSGKFTEEDAAFLAREYPEFSYDINKSK